MQELDDIALLRQYTEQNSEEAFAALVTRHVNKVYSVALRHTQNPHQAEEITQAVFVILARKAPHFGKRVILEGWLYQTARLTAVTFIRSEIRRARREQEAHMQSLLNENESEVWIQISPLLDAAMARLNEADRHAIVLRFIYGKSMKEIGAALGGSESAVKMRVNRALEKLHTIFIRRGINSTMATIAGAISANCVQVAPATLAKTATAVALAKGAAASGSTLTLIKGALKIMAWTKAQTAIVSVVVAGLAALSVIQHQAQVKLREQNQTLQQQQASLADQLAQLQRDRDDATNQLAGLIAENAQLKSNSNEDELLKLRAKVTQLRTANAQNDSNDPTDEAAKSIAARVKQMKQWLEQNPNEKIPELQYLTAQEWLRGANYTADLKTDDDFDRALSQLRRDAKRTFANSIGEALANYIAGNNGQLPGEISQLGSYFNPPVDGTILQRYQLLQTGNLSAIPNNGQLIAEKAPVDDQYDTLFTITATGYSYQGTGTSWVNGSGKGNFGTNITAKIKPFEGQ
jgi:RNA polymerase sigma factor (sigma-70 family)